MFYMKAIILCAGYATRLYPLTENVPKPLLSIREKPLLNYILERIEGIDLIDQIFIVTNNKFYSNFCSWKKSFYFSKDIKIINDGTLSNQDRLGGLGDLNLVLESEMINDDILVVAGDNLFDFDLQKFIKFFKQKDKCTIGLYDLEDLEKAKNFGILRIDSSNKIISFFEKPENPKSTLISTAIYLYNEKELERIKQYMESTGSKEGPGYLIPYFLKFQDVYGYVFKGKWWDVGTKENYKLANQKWQ
jgi:glucose-1-phosphate thymidylyltransferase